MKNRSKKATKKPANEVRMHKTKLKSGKRAVHPAGIYLKQGNLFFFHGLTHSESIEFEDGTSIETVPLRKNPDPKDKRRSYYNPKQESDAKSSFGKARKGWKLNPEDLKDFRKKHK